MRRRQDAHPQRLAYTKRYPSRHIPITLLDAACVGLGVTLAEIATALQTYAASQHQVDRCHAQTMQRYARQAAENKNACEAVSAWTETPSWNTTVSETTVSEVTLSDPTLSESTLGESGT